MKFTVVPQTARDTCIAIEQPVGYHSSAPRGCHDVSISSFVVAMSSQA
jgi:hypothetical protein